MGRRGRFGERVGGMGVNGAGSLRRNLLLAFVLTGSSKRKNKKNMISTETAMKLGVVTSMQLPSLRAVQNGSPAIRDTLQEHLWPATS